MKLNISNISLIKAIAITAVGSSIFYAGIRLGKGPVGIVTSISGITVGAFGMCKMIHEFEKGDLIDQLREQAMFWEQEAQKQQTENRRLVKTLQAMQENSISAQDFCSLSFLTPDSESHQILDDIENT